MHAACWKPFPPPADALKPGRGAGRRLADGAGRRAAVRRLPRAGGDRDRPRDPRRFRGARQARPAPAARVSEGRCRSRLFLFQTCDLTLAWRDKDGAAHAQAVSYMFVEPHMGSWSAVAMVDPARPGLVTHGSWAGPAVEPCWHGAAGGVVFALLLIGGLVLAAWKAQGEGAAGARRCPAARWSPVPVAFRGWGEGPSWRVRG